MADVPQRRGERRAIAIVGAAGRFPGASNLDALWRQVLERRSAAREVPAARWPVERDELLDPAGGPDRLISTRGCFLDPFAVDAAGLQVDQALVDSLDPLHQLALSVGVDAFRGAGADGLDRSRISVILANIVLPTEAASRLTREVFGDLAGGSASGRLPDRDVDRAVARKDVSIFSDGNGSVPAAALERQPAALPAALIARALGLGGGSYTLDAACASSLYALHLACLDLEAGRVDAVLAGGVSRPQALYTQVGFTQLQALSPSGSCSPFDTRADGLVVGEGAGIFLLQRLDDAIREGRQILGVIRGIGLSNDVGGSLLSPQSEGQLRAMRSAYQAAGWRPDDVELIECHGTGTPRGDAVELASLSALWAEAASREEPGAEVTGAAGAAPSSAEPASPESGALKGEARDTSERCVIGSVKANVGHLLTAAAATGLAKVLLAMREETLPPSANFEASTAAPELAASPFQVLTEARPWRRRGPRVPRRAAVSAFGFGGINAHLLVEEWIPASGSASTSPSASASSSASAADAPRPKKGRRQARKTAARSAKESETNTKSEDPSTTPAPIAIVGMAAHFGGLRDLRAFREAIFRGEPALDARPRHRWSGAGIPSDDPRGDALSRLPGAWLDQVEVPLGRYRIPPKEIPSLLPQQLLALEVAVSAIEDAGPGALGDAPRLRTGTLIGFGLDLETTNFHLRWILRRRLLARAARSGGIVDEARLDREVEALLPSLGPALDSARTLGALGGVVAGRISRELQLGGPSFSVSGEDGSGLRALEVAVRLLQAGDVDSMVVGAVELAGDLRQVLGADELRPFSSRGSTRPFDREADGPTVGEGAAAVVVKRLDDALRDGDRIYAVVRGIGSAAGGALGRGPSEDAYHAALRRAYAEARIPASRVGLLEADGSASPVLDALEAKALHDFFGAASEPRCTVTSAKAVIGHAGAAAGLASIVKASLALFHEVLPPLPGYREPALDLWSKGPFHMQREAQAWVRNRAEGPRVAGVSSIALDGSCLHAVLEGVDRPASEFRRERARPLGDRGVGLFLCEGSDEGELARSTAALRDHLQAEAPIEALAAAWHRRRGPGGRVAAGPALHEGGPLSDGAAASSSPRSEAGRDFPPAPLVRAFVGADRDEIFRQMDRPQRGGRLSGEVAFVFPGSGNHFVGMGRTLGVSFPEPIRALDAETMHLRDQLMPAYLAPWRAAWPKGAEAQAARALESTPERIILGQVAYGISMSDVVRSLGIEPHAVLGYSLGETTGLFSLRAWRDRDGMFGRTLASPLFRTELAGACEVARARWGVEVADWHAVVVNRSADEVRQALSGTARLLIVNAPGECVIGGRRGDVDFTVEQLGSEALPLAAVPTVHCDLVEPVADAYRELHLLETSAPAGVRFYSGAWGTSYEPTTDRAADSIVANATHGFDFRAVVEKAWEDGVRIFVELGPQGSCTRMIGRILAGKEHLAVSACQRDLDPARSVLQVAGRLAEAGVPIDLESIYGEAGGIEIAPPRAGEVIVVPNGGVRQLPEGLAPRPTNAPSSEEAQRPPMSDSTDRQRRTLPPPSMPPPAAPAATLLAGPIAAAPLTAAPPRGEGAAAPTHLAAAVAELGRLTRGVLDRARATAAVHDSFLTMAQRSLELQQLALSAEQQLQGQLAFHLPAGEVAAEPLTVSEERHHPQVEAPAQQNTTSEVAFDYDACMEFAIGKLGNVLGPAFSVVDGYPSRVRLPDVPLMLVDRILTVEGTLGELGPGRCVTEHDVEEGAWYLDGGRAPVCIVVESGQADLFLCSYLGIDLVTKGERLYRLLDAQMIVHRDLPRPGETVRYDIRINRFIRQGDTYLLFFEYDATIDGEALITMRGGCAGFFSPAQLASGRGIVEELGTNPPPRRLDAAGNETAAFRPLVPMEVETFDDDAIDALRDGDIGRAFGPHFEGITLPEPMRLPGGRMRLVDRIVELDPAGGRFGLGSVTGEADIEPDAWFLTCHFSDDPVMPGTLMYECCLHTLRVLLLRMGWVCDEAEAPDDLHYAPVVGHPSKLRCRGQVIPTTRKARYRIEVKEIGYDPEPYVIADASMYVDELHAVQMEGMSFRLVGMSQSQLEALWASRRGSEAAASAESTSTAAPGPSPGSASRSSATNGSAANLPFTESPSGRSRERGNPVRTPLTSTEIPRLRESTDAEGATNGASAAISSLFQDPHILPLGKTSRGRPIYTRAHIDAFATGRPSQAFGAPYLRFDEGRMARLPSHPLSFIDSIVPEAGEPWKLERGASAIAIYDVPPDAWYFEASGLREMPYAVLLETALQPCGWLAAWLGAALKSEAPLFFRNLEGDAAVHATVTPGTGRLTTHAHLDLVSEAGGMLLQQFTFETRSEAGPVISGTTRFGFFGEAALAQQAGIRLPPDGLWRPREEQRSIALPGGPYHFLDRIDALELEGGPNGKGFIAGSKEVDPADWFFAAHFHGDPVMPGSLGLDALLQLLQRFAAARWPQLAKTHRPICMPPPAPHKWTYRGQVLPQTGRMAIHATIQAIEDGPAPKLVADGVLLADGKAIYSMQNFSLSLVER